MKVYRLSMALLACLLPRRPKMTLYRYVLGYEISSSADIGISLVLVTQLRMGDCARIGHLNVIRGCETVDLGDHAQIGSLNWIGGHAVDDNGHYAEEVDRHPVLSVGRHAAITTRHLLDCTAGIYIGHYATVAGFRSQFLTHTVDLKRNKQRSESIEIGVYAFISTSVIMLPGTSVPDYSVLGAGSVLTKHLEKSFCLYAGQPAVEVKDLPHDLAYFNRLEGFVR